MINISFSHVRQAIKHLSRLGRHVITITCDGASDNCRMFAMFNEKATLSYKTVNIFSANKSEVFFISDPPHLIKTIRNCFARGKLWVCMWPIRYNILYVNAIFVHYSVWTRELIGI